MKATYHRYEKKFEYEGRKYAPLAEILFHGEPARALVVVKPHTCPHAIVELADDLNYLLRHAEAGEYFPQECSVDVIVRFGMIDKARNSFLP